jgi:hypothetical protein
MAAMPHFFDIASDFFVSLDGFAAANRAWLALFAASAVGSGVGAWAGGRAILSLSERRRAREVQAVANVSIAAMVALLGKLINFKKDLSLPAQAEAGALEGSLSAAPADKERIGIRLELWAEIPFELRLPHDRLLDHAGAELEVIQLVKMLDYNLAELSHLVRQRNALIQQMNGYQALKGSLPVDGLKLYLRYTGEIARNLDENLFFLDRGIGKIRAAAKRLLPEALHGGIADVGLKAEAGPLMPPRDLIKGWAA